MTHPFSLPIQRIVFATDLFENSRLALDYAAAFAFHYHAELTIVHAFELSNEAEDVEVRYRRPSVSREHILERLEALAVGIRRLGIEVNADLREGEPFEVVLACAEERKADLLVLGTHGAYKGLDHLLVGSLAEKILLSSPVPTLTVGRHVLAGIDLHLNLKRILLLSNRSAESAPAADYARSLADDLGVRIETMTISALDSEAVSPEDVLKRATTCADGLLVLGVHSESVWERHLHASFAFELIAKSGCPVISVQNLKS